MANVVDTVRTEKRRERGVGGRGGEMRGGDGKREEEGRGGEG